MADDDDWTAGLFSEYTINCCTCIYGTCFPMCALASAKSQFDGSELLFNFLCFSTNVSVVRQYIRSGYGIKAQTGTCDIFLSTCCWPCVITQLLNEVSIRGPGIDSQVSINENPWVVKREDVNLVSDPCDSCCTLANYPCEVSSAYSQLSGTPMWFGCLSCVNICQVRHLVRKSYSIGGGDLYRDCCVPFLCLSIPCTNCCYFNYEIVKIRGEMASRGIAQNFASNIRQDTNYHSVLVDMQSVASSNKKR